MSNGTEVALESERERRLVRLYMELTGSSEAAARGVFMQVGCSPRVEDGPQEDIGGGNRPSEEPVQGSFGRQFPYASGRLRAARLVVVPV
jgi:hypothetical protein